MIRQCLTEASTEIYEMRAAMRNGDGGGLVIDEVLARLATHQEELDQIMASECQAEYDMTMMARDQQDALALAYKTNVLVEENGEKLGELDEKTGKIENEVMKGFKEQQDQGRKHHQETMGEEGIKGLKDTAKANHSAIMGDDGFNGMRKTLASTETNVNAEMRNVSNEIKGRITLAMVMTMLGTAVIVGGAFKLAH